MSKTSVKRDRRQSMQCEEESLTTLVRLAFQTRHQKKASKRLERALIDSLDLLNEAKPVTAEPVRTLHHFACSGGTLISKCIAALPNIQLLSEVDPLAPLKGCRSEPQFAPTDFLQLATQSTQGTSSAALVEIFVSALQTIHRQCTNGGLRLVLRDHAHSHFCRGANIPIRPPFREIVSMGLSVRSLITVRHPMESYLSLQANDWVDFSPATLDEYCARYLSFLQANDDTPVVRYEDFVASPRNTMLQICSVLALPFNPDFEEVFNIFRLTGDSGRSGIVVAPRPRRTMTSELKSEAKTSANYAELTNRLGYADSFAEDDVI